MTKVSKRTPLATIPEVDEKSEHGTEGKNETGKKIVKTDRTSKVSSKGRETSRNIPTRIKIDKKLTERVDIGPMSAKKVLSPSLRDRSHIRAKESRIKLESKKEITPAESSSSTSGVETSPEASSRRRNVFSTPSMLALWSPDVVPTPGMLAAAARKTAIQARLRAAAREKRDQREKKQKSS